jgi:hypothetical protein
MFLLIPHYEDEYKIDPETGEVWSNHRQRLLEKRLNSSVYLYIGLSKNGEETKYYIHRLVYMAVYPEDDIDDYLIDHIDGNPLNNHWENLRKATRSENQWNMKAHKDNNLGLKNIRLTKSETYKVQISKNGKVVFCKTYNTIEEAIQNRDIQLKIHHQDFANYT